MAAPALSPPLFSTDYYQNPYPALDWLRANSPVHEFRFPGGDVPTWIVTRYADVRAVLGDPRFSTAGATWANPVARAAGMVYAEGTVVENILTVLDPPDHTRTRKLAMSAFTPRRTEQWRGTLIRVTDQALDRLASHEHPDVMDFASSVPAEVIGEILGIPLERFTEMLHSIDRAFSTDPALKDDRTKAFEEIGEYGRELIVEKRRRPADDLTSTFIQARDGDDRLSEHELVAMVALMIMVGLDTTRGLIGSATLALLEHPDQLQLLLRRPDLVPSAVEEFIRYEGTLANGIIRFTTEDMVLAGTQLPAGSPVLASLLAANRDPEQFADPNRLDITRTGNRHLGLGHGLHNCLGAALARMEAAIAIPALFTRFPAMELAVPRDEIRFVEAWLLRSIASLPVHLNVGGSLRNGG